MNRALALAVLGALAVGTFGAGLAHAADFTYRPPGELSSGSGKGRVDNKVYAPGMRFPIEAAPAYANSQVYGYGGGSGPAGSQCSTPNYSYPWKDNYCESRSWDMPLCPTGTGHQGQDIRPGTCAKDVHWVVAAADGTITNVGSYSVYLTGADGTRYDYLHMSNVQVGVGAKVKRGQRIGKVSNVFGGTPTTIHLHFNMRQTVSGVGTVFVPPYMSLVTSYQELVGPPPDVNDPPKGYLDSAGCDGIRGWAQDPDVADKPIQVHLYVDSKVGDAAAKIVKLNAGEERADLCGPLGSCNHAYTSDVPLSIQDGKPHEIRAIAIDSAGGTNVELTGSPKTITCATVVPEGVRRHVTTPASYTAWHFDGLWHQVTVADDKISAIPRGSDLPDEPKIVRGDDGAPEVWLLDSGFKRHIPNPDVLVAWSFGGTIEQMPAADLAALPKGPSVRSAPYLVQGSAPEVYLIDDAFGGSSGNPVADGGVGDAGGLEAAGEVAGDLDGSCGCRVGENRAPGVGVSLVALVGLLGLLRRRR